MTTRSPRQPELAASRPSPHLVIRPRRRFAAVDLSDLWAFRDVLGAFAARDLTLRYRQTALGPLWIVLQPVLGALIFSFVFGSVAHLPTHGVPYLLFAYSGLLGWNLFSNTLTRASTSLTAASAMVSKVYFPRMLLPLSTLAAVLLDFALSTCALAVFLVAYGVWPGWHILLTPVWVILMVTVATGVGLATSACAVRYRDVQYLVPTLLPLLTFASPVGYSMGAVPHTVRWATGINPLSGILEGFRWSLVGTGSLTVGRLAYSAAFAVGCLLLGAYVFASLEREFADVI